MEAPALGVDKYLDYMGVDKKVEGGKIRFVLLKKIGAAFVTSEVPEADLRGTLKESSENADLANYPRQ